MANKATARWAGLALFVLAAGFMTAIMLGASIAPGYDIRHGAISDLGVIPESAALFNATLLAVGLLNVLGGLLLYRARQIGVWVLAIFVLAGVGAAGAGLMPLDTGGPHGVFALLAFLFFNLEALAYATVAAGLMRWVSVAAGLVGLSFIVLMVVGDAGNPAVFGAIGHGGAERLIVYPAMLWMLALGGYLMAEGNVRRSALG